MIDLLTTDNLLFMIPVAVVIALIFAVYFLLDLKKKDSGTPEMRKISDAIETGAMAYLRRQYKTIGIISVIVAVLIAVAGIPEATKNYLGYPVAIAFLIGAGFSILSGFIGMKVSVTTNIKTASAARDSLNDSFKIAFRGGAVSGIIVSTLSILGLFAVFLAYNAVYGTGTIEGVNQTLLYVIGYAFGASFAALFAQLGGGIYTKAADVGADLVGKVEEGIPEDDPRNPAVIADLVGDNVGDCAGRGADIFESTAAEIIGSMIIGLAVLKISTGMGLSINWVLLPIVVMAFGLIASVVGIMTVRLKDTDKEVFSALNRGYYITMILILATSIFAVYWMLKDETGANWTYFAGCAVVGVLLALAIVYITQYYTGDHKPVQSIAEASETGPATNIIKGLSVGMESTLLPVICIVIAIVSTYVLGYYGAPGDGNIVFGIYGTAIGTVAMLASSAFILAEDTYGPITDNAGGIVEMSNEPAEVRDRTDLLDASGNTTKALTKGYAMASAALASFLLFAAFFTIVMDIKGVDFASNPLVFADNMVINFGNPLVFVGGMIGGVMVFYFTSLAISAVGKAAGEMIEEVRRQFREDPGIMEGTSDPDYAKCVDIATRGALKQMVLPALLPIIIPIVFGLLFRYVLPLEFAIEAPGAMGALMVVATIVGLLMANFLNNGGGAWDNAKKFIESGASGGKGSLAHDASIVGDTVGDPFKDTAGPSIHVLIKLLPTICMVTAILYVI